MLFQFSKVTGKFGLNEVRLRETFLDRSRHPQMCFELVELAADCCRLEPEKRPSVTDCLSRIETIRGELVVADSLSA